MGTRRKQVYNTYGRHRQRVVSVDIWGGDGPGGGGERGPRKRDHGLFSSFSSNDSGQNDSGEMGVVPHTTKEKRRTNIKENKNRNKENVFSHSQSWISDARTAIKHQKEKLEESSEIVNLRVLRDRSTNKDTTSLKREKRATNCRGRRKAAVKAADSILTTKDDSTCSVKQIGKKNTRKDVVKNKSRCVRSTRQNKTVDDDDKDVESSSIEHSRKGHMSRLNFSEFDNYSLMISGSPKMTDEVLDTPEIESAVTHKSSVVSHKNAYTSTPQASREEQIKCCLYDKLQTIGSAVMSNLNNLSHIELPTDHTPKLLTHVSTRRNRRLASPKLEDSLLEVNYKLDNLSLVSSIASVNDCSIENKENSKKDSNESLALHHVTATALSSPGCASTSSTSSGNPKSANTCSSQYDASKSLFDCQHGHSDTDNHLLPVISRTCNEKPCNNEISIEEDKASILSDEHSSLIHSLLNEEDEQEIVICSSSSVEEFDPGALSEIEEVSEDSCEENAEESEEDVVDEEEIVEQDLDCTCDGSGDADSQWTGVQDVSSPHDVSPHISKSSPEQTLSPSYHTCPSVSFKTPENPRLKGLKDELQMSGHSLRIYLTPVKVQTSGRESTISPREKVLTLCDQTDSISFKECIPQSMMRKCKKIGEGVYGEVFRSERNRQSVALKIIPIEGDFPVNDEQQKTFEEILPEIVISKELSALRDREDVTTENFVQVKGVSVVKGPYPDMLLKQWDIYHNSKVSENDRPDVFGDDQLFIIFEFNDCGSDLESFTLTSLHQAKSILYQITCSLAIAEESLQFEHRDLHWGNVLIKPTRASTVAYCLNGEKFEVESKGIVVSVIDFTLSRLSKDGCNVFTDLSVDPTLFEGQGDYQFDVYRLMREENGNKWEPHQPYTNVLWIHYLADKLIQGKSYAKSSSRDHQTISRQFRTFLRQATDYNSCLHLLAECPFFMDCVIKDS